MGLLFLTGFRYPNPRSCQRRGSPRNRFCPVEGDTRGMVTELGGDDLDKGRPSPAKKDFTVDSGVPSVFRTISTVFRTISTGWG